MVRLVRGSGVWEGAMTDEAGNEPDFQVRGFGCHVMCMEVH